MRNTIDLNIPVGKLISHYPELKNILVDLGFTPLNNPFMLKTVGHMTTLKTGCKMIKLPLETLIETLIINGYEVINEN